ncbi:MAG TPA: aminotransferase [Steroidobacteraceae bacterium]|nr:aminotransferase [Steroidobacteraceae bacterium]
MSTPMSATRTAELRRMDLAHHLPAQSDYKVQQQQGGSRIIVRAQGCTIEDAEGNRLLDGMAGLWCVNVGYGREELAQAAYRQMLELPFYNTFFKTANEPAIRLAAELSARLGADLTHVFFNSSGSEANDTALRLARHYWTLRGEPKRQIFISRWNAYHGSTVAGASLGGMKQMHAQGNLPIPGIEHVMQPYWFGDGFGEDPESFGARAAAAVEARIIQVGAENVAAFIGEPVQGAGGVIIPPPGYWKSVEAVCRKYGILLIVDEVICGFGRLGRWFGFQHFGIKPDIVSMAKGLSSGYLPISATAVAAPIVALLKEKGGEFIHGYTYSGHPTAAAVALCNLEIIAREHLVERVAEDTGPYLTKALAALAANPLVGEARSLGLIGAVEIVARRGTNLRFGGKEGHAGPLVRDACIRNGLMVRAVRDSIVFCPPLIVSHAQIDRLVATIDRSLREVEAQLRVLEAA